MQLQRDAVRRQDRPHLVAAFSLSRDSLSELHVEFRYQHPDSREMWLETHATPDAEPDGACVWHGALSDITARKATEADLRVSEVRLTEAQRTGRIGIWTADLERETVWFDLRARQMLGLPLDVTVWFSLAEAMGYWHPDDRDRLSAVLERCRSGREDRISLDYRHVRPDGRTRDVLVSGAAERDAEGRAVRLTGTIADVTGERARRRGLRESRERFERLFQMSPAAQFLVRVRDHRIVEANEAAGRFLGCPRSALIGLAAPSPLLDLSPDSQAQFWARLAARESTRKVRVDFTRRDGSPLHGEKSREVVRLGGQEYALIVIVDLTARQLAERAVESSEARLRQVTEGLSEAVWLLDVDSGTVLYTNPALWTLLGRPPSATFTAAEWIAAVHPEDAALVRDREHELRSLTEGTAVATYRIVRPNGDVRWVRSRARVAASGKSGEGRRLVGVFADITEQRAAEQRLLQTQKMESLGLLASGVAHDFNNWLTVIVGFLELLRAAIPPDSTTGKWVAEIRLACDRASGLTRQLLAFSRSDVVEPQVIEINTLVADAQRMLRRLLGEDITLTSKLDPHAGRVKVDPTQWAQVLTNLAVNARDAMPTGGRLTLETRLVDVNARHAAVHDVPPGRYVRLSVTDTGAGIPEDIQPLVFEPFFTTKAPGRGTGIGLTVVAAAVERSGGFVEFSSQHGRGTRFNLFVPESLESTAPNVLPVSAELSGCERVLVVEDEGSLRDVASFTLRGYGYDVLQASGGEEAIRVLHEHGADIDVLFTDVVMPGKGGRAVADAALAEWPHIRVLYTSGYTEDAMLRHGVERGAVTFLQKPYSPRELLTKIRRVLQ